MHPERSHPLHNRPRWRRMAAAGPSEHNNQTSPTGTFVVTTIRLSRSTFRPELERLESRDPAASIGPSAAEQFLLERINDLRSNPWAFDPRIKRVVIAQGVTTGNLR